MPLVPIERQWDFAGSYKPLESNVAKVLRDVGGGAVYRQAYFGTERTVARVTWYESFGMYPWRVSLRETYPNQESWRNVDQYPTFREAEAAAKRYVRLGAIAVPDGDDWRAEC